MSADYIAEEQGTKSFNVKEEMSDCIYNDVIRTESEGMQTEREEMTVEIYESEMDHDFRTEINTHQALQGSGNYAHDINTDGTQDLDRGIQRNHTGSDCVRISRASPVYLLLLCVLLLTAVIVLCVQIHTKSTHYTEEKDQQLSKLTNQTGERDQLLNQNITLTNERDGVTKNYYQTNERDQFNQARNELWKLLNEMDGYIYQSSFYYMSSEEKNWTESRRYCRERGADLIIINNKEKEDFVKKMSGKTAVWMGLTDSDVEGRWTWVDGSTLTYRSWKYGEPNGYVKENCAVLYSSGWYDYPCNDAYKCICVKNIEKISN